MINTQNRKTYFNMKKDYLRSYSVMATFLDCEFSHVIMSLVDLTHGKKGHVRYRDSRLTFLLQVRTSRYQYHAIVLLVAVFP